MRLLVVDDSPLDRALVAELGHLHGIEVSEADDTDSALEHAATVDVVLLDGHMPGVDIADIATRLHHQSDARIILWSGAPERVEGHLPRGLVDQVVMKPTDLTKFEETFLSTVMLSA